MPLYQFCYKSHVIGDDIYLSYATVSDDGVYTCRVSTFLKTRFIATKLVVGNKPKFSSPEVEEIIDFVYELSGFLTMNCEAYCEPPTYAKWTHDGEAMDNTDMSLILGMKLGATGIYKCEVSNKFGSIRRSFKVTSRDCLLDIKKSFVGNHPITYSKSGWPDFRVEGVEKNYVILPHKYAFYIRCPSPGFINPELSRYFHTMAYCERDSIVKIAGKPYNFADLQCKKEVEPIFKYTKTKCYGYNTEIVHVGFMLQEHYFMKIYEVCFDKVNDVPLFTRHILSPQHTNVPSTSQWYSSSDTSAKEFEELYNCRRQLYDVGIALGRGLRSMSCCFGRRQLVNPRDLPPGVPVTATFEYKNVVPHWSSCNSKNWDELEALVRQLAKQTGRNLTVFTGTSNGNHSKTSVDIEINNGRDRYQKIPPYLWKVVQDPDKDSAVAIIQVNIPELTQKEAEKHVLCPDICFDIEWMQGPEWDNADNGYTYCCTMEDFKRAFRYTSLHIPSMTQLLVDAKRTGLQCSGVFMIVSAVDPGLQELPWFG
ncbi:hypothetical protein SFRURICE_010164, partial [Spodoptera frugiperda]